MSKTSAPAAQLSYNRYQVTSVLIERGILVLLQPSTPAVDVRIYYGSQTTAGLREQFVNLDAKWSGYSAIWLRRYQRTKLYLQLRGLVPPLRRGPLTDK